MTNIRRALQAAAGVDEPFDAEDVFSTALYVGDSTDPHAINNGINLAGKGGMVWTKAREWAISHYVYDTERGVDEAIFPNKTDYETADRDFSSFDSEGYTLKAGNGTNSNTENYVSWTFREAPGFFDIVKFDGESGGTTISHNLGSVPGLVITKRIDDTGDWYVWRSSDLTAELYLNSVTGEASVTQPAASSTEWTLRSGLSNPSATYVSYLFASLDGISKVGTYSGTEVAQNIECGFGTTARFLIIKRADNVGSWNIVDSTRGYGAGNDPVLWADSSAVESTGIDFVTTYSGGFAVTTSGQVNTDTATYIYLAIA